MKLSSFKDISARRRFIEQSCNVSLDTVGSILTDSPENIHCENLIGGVSLPLGIAGPVKIISDAKSMREVFIPLATTEGALVASVSRGAKAVTESGGVRVTLNKPGASRGPVFATDSIDEGRALETYLTSNYSHLAGVAASTSHHISLTDMQLKILPNFAFVRFMFDTQDAMGMNMVTIATQKIVDVIVRNTGVRCISIAGNFDIDKKPAWLNFIRGKGFTANAEVNVSASILSEVLKTTAQSLIEVWIAKNMIGSAVAGSCGFNAHFANVIAAFYAATGQDIAHVVEGSLGITTARLDKNDRLYFSVHLPSIMIGTVGGGTKLQSQTQARSITGAKSSFELAEVLAAAVLCGELSLLSSLAEGSLVKAHKKLGR